MDLGFNAMKKAAEKRGGESERVFCITKTTR